MNSKIEKNKIKQINFIADKDNRRLYIVPTTVSDVEGNLFDDYYQNLACICVFLRLSIGF